MNGRIWAFLWLFLCLPLLSNAAGTSAQDYEEMGQALYDRGLYAKSVNYFLKATQADPNSWSAYEKLGDAYSKMGDAVKAKEAYRKSFQLNPDHSDSTHPSEESNFDSEDNLEESPTIVPTPTPVGTEIRRPMPTTRIGRLRLAEELSARNGSSVINYSRFWGRVELGYNYSAQGDLLNSARILTGQIADNGWLGSSTAGNHGLNMGADLGFQWDPYNGIALGIRYLRAPDYTINLNFQNDPSPDFEEATFQPSVLPITLDYYLFLPDKDGRFFLSAGAGLYPGRVHVDENYDFSVQLADPNAHNTFTGDLDTWGFGFQLGVGREWALNDHVGLSLFAKGRYAKLSRFQGILVDSTGATGNFGLATFSDGTVDVDNTYNIGGGGETYTTIDFTGFDAGVALVFYAY